MVERRSLNIDRRSGKDRRKAYKLGYFLTGEAEKRSGEERRSPVERRRDWIKASECCSAFLGTMRK